MKKIYSYTRCSSAAQLRGDSLRRQRDSIEKYRKEGYELDDTLDLSDKAVSGWSGANLKKGKLGLFLHKIEDGTVIPGSILLVESLDRITRQSLTTAQSIFLEILNAGIKIVTLIDDQEYSKEDLDKNPFKIFGSISILNRAHEESQTKSIRLKNTWVQKRKTIGEKFYTNKIPSWLERDGDKIGFSIKKGCREIIQKMFQMVLDGNHCEGIAKEFRNRKIPTIGRRKTWGHSYVAITLRNRAVIGEFQPCEIVDGKRKPVGDLIENYYPPIISESVFNQVNLIMDGRTKNTAGRVGTQNIFRKMLKCGYCGAPMYRNRKGGDKYRKNGSTFYVCSRAKEKIGCFYYAWNAKEFEEDFISLSSEMKSEMWTQENRKGILHELELTQSEANQIKKKIKRIIDVISDSDSASRSLVSSLADLEKLEDSKSIKIKELERRHLQSLQMDNPVDELEAVMRKINEPLVRSRAAEVITRLFEEIILFPAGTRFQFAKIQSYAKKLERELPPETKNRSNVISALVRDHSDRKKNRFFCAKLKRAGAGRRLTYPKNALSASDLIELDDLPDGADIQIAIPGDELDQNEN